MRKLQLCLLICTVVFATGCPKYRPKVDFENPGSFIGKLNTHLAQAQHNYECYRFGPAHTDAQGKSCAGFTQDNAKAKAVRNELLESTLPYIDSAYVDFITDIQAGRDRTNFVADVIDLGAAAAVGITNGERPLQILGVAITAFRGGRKAADANFYKEQSTPILITQMDGNRAKVRAIILERETKDVDAYSLGAAISDIVDYYNAGTLVRAFTQLQNDTAAATQASEAQLEKLKKEAGIKSAPSKEELEASNEFRDAILAHVRAFNTGTTSIATAEAQITAAEQAMTQANAAISQADQDIGTATQQIATAANPTATAQAQAAKALAEKAKADAEKKKLQAENDKKAAETAKASAIEAKDKALTNLRGVFDAIAADPKLSPLLSKSIEDDANLDPPFKATLRAALQRLLQKPVPTTDAEKAQLKEDYGKVLLQFQGSVAEAITTEPALSTRLREILNANK